MIVHIFTANRYHLAPDIARGYVKNYNQFDHVIILFGDQNTNQELYISMFDELDFEDYHFCSNKSDFIKLLKRYKKEPILFHAGNYSWFLLTILYGVKNINWVCWGAGSSIGESLKSKLFTPIKTFIYNSFKSIVVLMDQDKDTIIRDFKVKPERIKTISYATKNKVLPDIFYDENILNPVVNNTKPLVLLGNNPGSMSNYLEMLDKLAHFSGKILVQCMLHYGLVKNETYYSLLEKGEKIFGDDFRSNEEFYENRIDYINYMNKCDIYISGSMKQTGLGAINMSLRLGKKIFITGKNFEWMQSKGMKIFNVDEISPNMDIDDFAQPLSLKEKKYNLGVIRETSKENPKKWIEYFKHIEREQ